MTEIRFLPPVAKFIKKLKDKKLKRLYQEAVDKNFYRKNGDVALRKSYTRYCKF